MRKVWKWLGLGVLGLVGIIAFNTVRYKPPVLVTADVTLPTVDGMEVATKLSEAIQFKTISHPLGEPNRPSDYQEFLDWLDIAFPNFIGATSVDYVSGFTPIFKWQGTDPGLDGVLISGHYDVVPIESEWSVDPWAGEISDGFVWGRGTLDMKGVAISFLEALDRLAVEGFEPKRDIYVTLTQDEEIGGLGGAQAVVEYFRTNNISLDWSLDEGSFVLRNIVSTVPKDIAAINVAEKGYMTVEITARSEGGHSSLPQRETAVFNLAEALHNLHDAPIDGGLTGLTADFFDDLGRHMGLAERVLFANSWLFKPVIEMVLSRANTTDAMLRTTTAPTMLDGSNAENVLPQRATATVNFRLHPRDTAQTVLDHLNGTIDVEGIEYNVLTSSPASPVSAHDNEAFDLLANATAAVFGDVAIVPGLMVAGSDSRYYSQYTTDSYRFAPFIFTDEDLPRVHGKDERVSIDNLQKAVQYYILVFGAL
ncbi:MAG: M20/M25/M40 family metallo-hydrolase [Pseudomonadota bacterium]